MKKILFIIFAYSSYNFTFIDNFTVLEKNLQDLTANLQAYPTFAAWKYVCDNNKYPATPLNFEEFKKTITDFCELQNKMLNAGPWLDTQPTFLEIKHTVTGFHPWIEKKVLPAGVQLLFHADIHGDSVSLLKYLLVYVDLESDFKLSNPNQYFIFLGDYSDRGMAGAEVLYTLLRLKLANPDHVILLRGNHEDVAINESYGFLDELKEKFKAIKLRDFSKVLNTCYSYMPVALFLGIKNTNANYINYLLCCHGGLEIGYQPQKLLESPNKNSYQLITSLSPIATIQQIPELIKAPGEYFSQNFYESDPATENSIQKLTQTLPKKDKLKEPADIGFLWSDFEVDQKKPLLYSSKRGAGLIYGKNITEALLESYGSADYSVVGIMRGHQQSGSQTPMMHSILANKGVSTLWQNQNPKALPKINLYKNIVCTFNVTPEIYGAGRFDYDTHGIVITSNEPFAQWKFEIKNLKR
ncbi:MAG: metallophosphoesterase [Candidatus Babeliaceae bacterium]